MKTFRFLSVLFLLSLFFSGEIGFAQKRYDYKTYPNDPLQVREYTLSNGLKVFLSVYKGEPRIQTYIAVRVGGKNDPAETTGLAHYFEHMMFKGTQNFGTADWEKEKVIVQAIENQFEVYRNLTDSLARAQAYHIIDSLSYEASKIAIPNEYDKLMTAIGANGTNAGTSNDYTIYMENIPANQLRSWAEIQSDRFSNPVLRLFHTEIETVYEEKNMSLTNDGRRVRESMYASLFPNHPYGKQTVLGTQEHLKNPSLKNIRQFFDTYYVPNNMAIILAGDFDPDSAIIFVDQYFGGLQSKEVPKLNFPAEAPITSPIATEITGLEAENVTLAFRAKGTGTEDEILLDILGNILYNGKAGLIDLNLNQEQKVMMAYGYGAAFTDHGFLQMYGKPKTGQTLAEVKDLLLDQIDLVRKGDFPDWMLEASINNKKYELLKRYESVEGRAMTIAYTYLDGQPWEAYLQYIDKLEKITKEDIIKFANEKCLDNNYVVVYKRQGKPEESAKIQKPAITPIETNRDSESVFLKNIKEESANAPAIQPNFVDYAKAITMGKIGKNVELLYIENKENKTFEIIYLFEMGTFHDQMLGLAFQYMDYLGTSKYSPKEIKQEYYKLACDFQVHATQERVYVSISGLSENMEKLVTLTESLFKDCQPNPEALQNLVMDVLQGRIDAKANQRVNSSALLRYATYGKDNPSTYILSEEKLKSITPEELIAKIKSLNSYEHKILFYGSQPFAEVQKSLNKLHKTPSKLKGMPEKKEFPILDNPENKVLFAQYDAKQSYCYTVSKGVPFNREMEPVINVYNSYFGGGMNAIVFQEMREKRSLAYSAWATYSAPQYPNEHYRNISFIATQNDKVADAFTAFNELFNDMPRAEKSFDLAKESILSDLRTQRVRNSGIFWAYLQDIRMGYPENSRKILYEALPKVSMQDMINFNETYVKNKKKTYTILGNESDFDLQALEKAFGPVKKLTQEEIFGY